MSYILDALRKSDQQRRRGAAPTLPADLGTAVAPKQSAFLRYGLVAAVLVGGGIMIGLLRPWQPEQLAPGAGPIAAKPLAPISPQTAPAPAVFPELARKLNQELPVRKSAATAHALPAGAAMKRDIPAPAKTEAQNTRPKAIAAVPTEKTAMPVPEKRIGTGLADAAAEPRVMTIAELPLSIQQEMPRISVSVHAYSSKPRERLVGINDRLLREGASVAPGFTLEEITPDGMIFSYKGYRFRRGVQGSGAMGETQ